MKVAQLGEGHVDALLCVIRRMVEKSAVEEMQEYVCTAGEIGRCIKEPLIIDCLKLRLHRIMCARRRAMSCLALRCVALLRGVNAV